MKILSKILSKILLIIVILGLPYSIYIALTSPIGTENTIRLGTTTVLYILLYVIAISLEDKY